VSKSVAENMATQASVVSSAFIKLVLVERPKDPKLSDGGGWRDGCTGEGGGAASVTAGAVRCSAWLGDV
jgi:hypothetical protein